MLEIKEILSKYDIKPLRYEKNGKATIIRTNSGSVVIKPKKQNTIIQKYLESRSFYYQPKILNKDDDEYEIDLDDDYVDKDSLSQYGKDGMKGLENWQDDWDKFDDDDYFPYESKNIKGKKVNEVKLNDFGNHPAYRKIPMTTPPNKEVAINGAKEWDDESAQGEEPFGQQIGDSAPYDDVIETMTESILASIYGSKKKV